MHEKVGDVDLDFSKGQEPGPGEENKALSYFMDRNAPIPDY